MLKSGPTPRTVIFWPSPFTRSIDTPEMRCSDSARFVSGNLPMSSATMPSTMPSELRFRFSVDCIEARTPVTTTCGAGSVGVATPGDSCACADGTRAAHAPATASAIVRRRIWGTVLPRLALFISSPCCCGKEHRARQCGAGVLRLQRACKSIRGSVADPGRQDCRGIRWCASGRADSVAGHCVVLSSFCFLDGRTPTKWLR